MSAQAPILDEAQAAAVAHRTAAHGTAAHRTAAHGTAAHNAGAHHTADRRAAATHRHDAGVLRVLGAPGTGKTFTAIEIVVDRLSRDRIALDQCLVLTPPRTPAADLRNRITARIGGTTTEPLARTHQALGFSICLLYTSPSPRDRTRSRMPS